MEVLCVEKATVSIRMAISENNCFEQNLRELFSKTFEPIDHLKFKVAISELDRF